MKRLFACLLLLLLTTSAQAQHLIEHGGYKLLTFDAPNVEYQSTREGKFTATYFLGKIGEGNLRITVKSKGFLTQLDADKRFSADKRDKREDPGTRITDLLEVPGALHTLTYSITDPYVGKGITVYTANFRSDILVTGTKEAAAEVGPTYKHILESLKLVPRTKIGDLKVEE